MLNEQKGNMYNWVTHTWNPIKGKCSHDCHYCYMKKWGNEQKPVRLVEYELKTDLGQGNVIFVVSGCDMWAEDIPSEWINQILFHCRTYPRNTYLFQSKNPDRFHSFEYELPSDSIIGTTIESDIWYPEMGCSPVPLSRYGAILNLKQSGFETMITIEPVMKFNLYSFIEWMKNADPDWINIGANTHSGVKLKEPTKNELKYFIREVSRHIEIKKKSNLKRLLK